MLYNDYPDSDLNIVTAHGYQGHETNNILVIQHKSKSNTWKEATNL